ncbi:phage tail protein [Cohnella faecalis]|uniref:Phage tail protein n=1 Tax=Cohnella faecalis TaxID=2315694 RepID=A0A398CIJ1_9BACL|nr:tail fiber protein [Cohnella faecalis]RIE00668.1 phage tail protein [Cohnella faecalis]
MSDQYVGEIRIFSGNYAPQGWAMCNGQLLPVSGNELLFAVIGAKYGGDGKTTFALPDLRGRLPIHMSSAYAFASKGGTETVTLDLAALPAHTHVVNANSLPGTSDSPSNAFWAGSTLNQYSTAGSNGTMDSLTVSSAGGNQAHNNVMPYSVLTFIIALQGIYPQHSS